MFNRFIRKLLNRRQEKSRYPLRLKVKTTIAAGEDLGFMSEDISEQGIRIRSQEHGITDILGSMDELSLEIFLEAEVPPVSVQAKPIWAFVPSGTVSGWEFIELRGRSLRRFRTFVDRTGGRAVPEVEAE